MTPHSEDTGPLLGADAEHEGVRTRIPAWRRVRFRYWDGHKLPRLDNYVALERLATCLTAGTCTDSERKIILLASFHFGHSELGWNGGEQVWARSMLSAFRELNHTVLFSWGHMDTLLNYQALPELVTHVLWERKEFLVCQERNDTNYREMDKEDFATKPWHDWQTGPKRCMQADDYPQGIPYWKSFHFWFFVETDHPLGGHWILSPEDYDLWYGKKPNHTYLGYSIEHRCNQFPTFDHREHRGLILAKTLNYFEQKINGFYNIIGKARDGVQPISENGKEVKFELVTTVGEKGTHIEDPDIESLGRMDQKAWTEVLARSKLLLGIGRPIVSPSPYYALCMGVPFIQPVGWWNKHRPDDRSAWQTQQMGMRMLEEPYVYHVKAGDEEGLRAAMQRAVDNPIPRYIPPHMTWDAFMGRVRSFLARDWQAEAKQHIVQTYADAPKWQYLAMDSPYKGTSMTLTFPPDRMWLMVLVPRRGSAHNNISSLQSIGGERKGKAEAG
ncbi:hypothetical protein CC85DRAFT_310485 [Cutaneotrichosporon oleaginosum]|uniref:Glycosyltransferase family 18 catalytic domain-containing protein n=1 Tax=Cutaneotrichosporon oleaginosum TaxID=879819 RepID=A0A0J0XXG7_9TREE|nr:uncharacterized protein CC85DRAFT_310485 [Cutaneotrichosporon oleaginosum]KLT45760.1 hypothetical protein CC85DRAFT_310485 [Cutaneotrichosporon oleaginosum]